VKIRAGLRRRALAALPAKGARLLTDMGQGDTSLLPPTSTGRSEPPA
jgi:hypothetical protein